MVKVGRSTVQSGAGRKSTAEISDAVAKLKLVPNASPPA